MTSDRACPCLYAQPCHDYCACVTSLSSSGCARCCSYGSAEQRAAMAARLAAAIDRDRDLRQRAVFAWARVAFGEAEATSLPQRGLRLLEEAIETFQACGGDEKIAHDLVAFVFSRPKGTVAQELGGVAVTTLALAAAAGLSADEEEHREICRVLSRPPEEFARRNADKNAAGFKIA